MQKTMIFDNHKIKISYKREDGSDCSLNPDRIRKQKLTWLNVGLILRLHKRKDYLFDLMRNLPNTEIESLRALAKQVTITEYALQRAWKFRKNKIWHKFWDLPHCKCPFLDNEDRYPSNFGYYINGECVLHGTKSVHS